jgi:hypothetical protein
MGVEREHNLLILKQSNKLSEEVSFNKHPRGEASPSIIFFVIPSSTPQTEYAFPPFLIK